jgi:hypothetical protein
LRFNPVLSAKAPINADLVIGFVAPLVLFAFAILHPQFLEKKEGTQRET